jgi:hypothetical protein
MSRVINDIRYTITEGIRTVCEVSLTTYDTLALTELEQYAGCHS